MSAQKPKSLQECVNYTNFLFSERDNNVVNIPTSSTYDLDHLIDNLKAFSQALVFNQERDIPAQASPKKAAFDEAINQFRSACKTKIEYKND